MASPLTFPTAHKAILEKLDDIDPVKYGSTRNYLDGAVTRLSPYISRGVLSTRQVLAKVLAKGYSIEKIEPFVKELCWRDYFQRVAQEKEINQDLRQPQHPVRHQGIPASVLTATTGIEGIDQSIQSLYQTGYMHNHCRMYTASLVCNVAQCHWRLPAQWMYYHLLDGDWASNACSWQWVAGANSSKKYLMNQENINKYTHTNQQKTFLDKSYEQLGSMEIPDAVAVCGAFKPEAWLPDPANITINPQEPVFIYNYYNLDPAWHAGEPGNRILLLEPEFFAQYPVSKQCVDFMLALSKEIPELQVYVGSFDSLAARLQGEKIIYKEHPFNKHYRGIPDERDWICPQITGYYPSFFAYWKKIEKQLRKNFL